MLSIGRKVTLRFAAKGSTTDTLIAGVIRDQCIDKADGANGPVGQCYKVITLETARPENGGHQYLGERTLLTSNWAIAPRKFEVPELDSFASLEDLEDAMYEQRQAAHIARIQAQAPVEAVAADQVPF